MSFAAYLYTDRVVCIWQKVPYKTKQICDWFWENPPVVNKVKHLEIYNLIIQSAIYFKNLNHGKQRIRGDTYNCHCTYVIMTLASLLLN